MKHKLLPLLLAVTLLTSCSTAYKSTQTPDDVYYSPAPPAETKKNEDKYENYTSSNDDDYIRMKIRNRTRWQSLDDFDYWNDTRYYQNTYSFFQNNWNNGYIWNNWNNPFVSFGYVNHCNCYCPYNNIKTGFYTPIKQSPVTRPDLKTYGNTKYNNSNALGNTIKKVFSDGRSYNNKNSESSSSSSNGRSYSPSSGSSSSSGSGSSGSVSRPPRN